MSEKELKEIYTFALDLGRRAGKILLDGVDKRTGEQSGRDVGIMEEKMNAVDIVGLHSSPCQDSDTDLENFRSRRRISVRSQFLSKELGKC
jgi:hypothetical protein